MNDPYNSVARPPESDVVNVDVTTAEVRVVDQALERRRLAIFQGEELDHDLK